MDDEIPATVALKAHEHSEEDIQVRLAIRMYFNDRSVKLIRMFLFRQMRETILLVLHVSTSLVCDSHVDILYASRFLNKTALHVTASPPPTVA